MRIFFCNFYYWLGYMLDMDDYYYNDDIWYWLNTTQSNYFWNIWSEWYRLMIDQSSSSYFFYKHLNGKG